MKIKIGSLIPFKALVWMNLGEKSIFQAMN
jgi:hypothetical protein